MKDVEIFLFASGAFVFFFLLHVIAFRRIDHTQVIKWVMLLFVTTGGIHVFVVFVLMRDVFVTAVSLVLYAFAVILYIMWIFGPIESSLRLHVLHDIAQAGEKGIALSVLRSRFTNELMMEKRLKRFLASGEIREENGRYFWNKTFSYFILNDYLHTLFVWMYKSR